MQDFQIVLQNICTLVTCMAIGFIGYKKKIITEALNKGLSAILIQVTLPCMVIYSMQKPFSMELLRESGVVLMISFGIFFLGTLTAYVLCRLLRVKDKDRGIYLFGMTLPNIIYMGFPVIQSIYGADALFYVSISNIAFNLICFTAGMKLITIGYEADTPLNLKKIISNAAIIATIIGLFLFLFSITLPKFLNDAFSMVGSMTTPLSMMIIGVILARFDLRQMFGNPKMYIFLILRLIVLPVIVLLLLSPFIHNDMLLGVLVILAAMPVGAVTAIFAEQYGTNAELGSKFVCLTTIVSVGTIPLITALIKALGNR